MKSKFTYTTGIRKIRKMETRKKVIQGGTSGGKTYAILAVLIDMAAREAGLEISVVSESIPHLRRGALKDFLSIMKMTNRFFPEHFNKTHLKYEFANGSYIEFFSVDDESKLRGARRNVLFVNEANNIKYDAYLQLSIRTSGDIFIDFNPTHRFWAHTEVLNEDDAELLILNYVDNEALPQSIVKELESNRKKAIHSSYWKNWCKVYLDGMVGTLEGVVFDDWREVEGVPADARLVGYGLDFGYTNDPTAVVAVYQMDQELYIKEIIYQKGLSNSDISKLLKAHGVQGEIYADSAEPKSIDELKRYGHRVYGTKKGADSVKFGIDILQTFQLNVTKDSYNLKDELNKYSWRKADEGYDNVPVDAFNHACDAMRYLAMMKLSQKRKGRMTIMR